MVDLQPDLKLVAEHCNTYRVYDDIEDGWESLKALVKYYGDNGRSFVNYSGPGNWNDPDQVVIVDWSNVCRYLQVINIFHITSNS